jgi:hypothetical protein
MGLFQAGEIALGRRIAPQKQDSGLREGPLEIGSADLRARGPQACAGGFLGTCDASALGDELLDPGEAGEVMTLVA